MLAAIKRCASLVEFSLITVKATWPGLMCFKPSLREINLQFGGKMEETRTMLHAAIPALRSASSKLDRRSRCFPTPLVRKIFFATNAMSSTGLRCLHEIELKKPAPQKLASTRSDVNGIQRACVLSVSQACRQRAELLRLDEIFVAELDGLCSGRELLRIAGGAGPAKRDPPVRSA